VKGLASLPEDFLAAAGYVAVARADLDKGFLLSACLTAQKAGEVALQSWLRTQGLSADAEGMPVLLAGMPGRTPELESAAARLERFRMDMHSPYRSAAGPDPDATREEAALCCVAAEAIVRHVRSLFGPGVEQRPGANTPESPRRAAP
jgi:HEPN domain-containing protein